MSELAILLVHYRTPGLLVEAVRALTEELEASRLEAEILVIDNGSEPSERDAWRELPIRRLDPGRNLGYAGGVRLGVESSAAPQLVAMNPDVLVERGCLARLREALAAGADAAGPQFFWDRSWRLRLPPTEPRSLWAELRTALARRRGASSWLTAVARRAWRRHARRHWSAEESFASTALSGALLAFRRDAWQRVGPFDDAFQLYFEETDWLLRLRAAGGRALFVPAARAVHLYAQSSVQEPRATGWFGEAERLFRRRHLGRPAAAFLGALGRERPAPAPAKPRLRRAIPALEPERANSFRQGTWLEVALSEIGFPAAAELLPPGAGAWTLPEEIGARLAGQRLYVRAADAAGRESAVAGFELGGEPASESGHGAEAPR